MSLTPEGEAVIERARGILADMEELDRLLLGTRQSPKGLLRVNATLGFGRSHVAPVISRFVPPPRGRSAVAAFGEPAAADRRQLRRLPALWCAAGRSASSRAGSPRTVGCCAAPAYLRTHGEPLTPAELDTIDASAFVRATKPTAWRPSSGKGARKRTDTVKTRGHLTTNDGEIAVNWRWTGTAS